MKELYDELLEIIQSVREDENNSLSLLELNMHITKNKYIIENDERYLCLKMINTIKKENDFNKKQEKNYNFEKSENFMYAIQSIDPKLENMVISKK